MDLDELKAVVAPPQPPTDIGGSWTPVETRLGMPLPGDFKAFVDTYGTGCLDDFLWVLNPFSTNPNLNLMIRGEAALRALRELQSSRIEKVPYPLHPAAGGLLPWGITDNGDVLYWLTAGAPDEWPVVLNAARDARIERYDFGMAMFLVKVLRGDVVSRIFPADFRAGEHSFRGIA